MNVPVREEVAFLMMLKLFLSYLSLSFELQQDLKLVWGGRGTWLKRLGNKAIYSHVGAAYLQAVCGWEGKRYGSAGFPRAIFFMGKGLCRCVTTWYAANSVALVKWKQSICKGSVLPRQLCLPSLFQSGVWPWYAFSFQQRVTKEKLS